jgi:SagB-type dehydrogenase family enzyme
MKGIGTEFMERTRYEALALSDQARGVPQPPLELALPPDALALVDLPAPSGLDLGGVALRDAIGARRSLREYSEEPLSLAELSFLLWATQGVRETVPGRFTLRTVPSAGARHPFETLFLANRIEGLPRGLYRFLATAHRLARLPAPGDVADRVATAALGQEMVKRSAATFIWIAVPERTTWRYGERGYRYLHLDAGHVAQNLYLAAESVGAGGCAIAAFSDDEMNALLRLDGEQQFVIYLASVGKRPRSR